MNCNGISLTNETIYQCSTDTFQINLLDINQLPYYIEVSDIEWRVSKYGEYECLVSKKMSDKNGIELNDNVITVTINKNDTEYIYGKMLHQIIITDTLNNNFVIQLGTLTILPVIR